MEDNRDRAIPEWVVDRLTLECPEDRLTPEWEVAKGVKADSQEDKVVSI